MDDDKKKRLEELRDKLNPDILAKVAESMGKSPVPSTSDSGGATSGGGGGGKRVNLKVKNMQKRFDYSAPKRETKSISIVISNDFIKGRTLQNSMKKLRFEHVKLVEESRTGFELILKSLNEKKKINIILINVDAFLDFKKIVSSLPEEKTGFLRALPIVVAVPENQRVVYGQLREAGLKNVILYPTHLKNREEFDRVVELP